MLKFLFNALLFVLLTLLTQIGGVAWLSALMFKRRLLAFATLYTALTIATAFVAPFGGRVALDCFSDGPLQMQTKLYCALNRHYVDPELRDVLRDAAAKVDREFPGTKTRVLDANFPFFDGFPLLPHLSHDDGEKADLAFYYMKDGEYLAGTTRSPLGYFAFEPGPTDCPGVWPSLRWDLNALQPLWRELELEPERMRAIMGALTSDARVGRIFLEPHLVQKLDVSHPKVRFQGCRAARHDDHIHFQLN